MWGYFVFPERFPDLSQRLNMCFLWPIAYPVYAFFTKYWAFLSLDLALNLPDSLEWPWASEPPKYTFKGLGVHQPDLIYVVVLIPAFCACQASPCQKSYAFFSLKIVSIYFRQFFENLMPGYSIFFITLTPLFFPHNSYQVHSLTSQLPQHYVLSFILNPLSPVCTAHVHIGLGPSTEA